MGEWQIWKLHTPGDYAGFFAILLAGCAVLYAATQYLKKNRTREKALARTASLSCSAEAKASVAAPTCATWALRTRGSFFPRLR